MKTVQVLLSAFNGEKYIRQQLDSILSQNKCEIRLLIRDDGSEDATCEILKEYETKYANVNVIFGKNIGLIQSFFYLMNHAENADYYALSDQDDVWLPDKLRRAINLLEKKKSAYCELPLLYASAQQSVDENLKFLQKPVNFSNYKPSFGNALVENICTGCTCVFNQELKKLICKGTPKHVVMHDFWLYLVASCFGKVIFDHSSNILYRQHSGNVLGMPSSWIKQVQRRVKNFKNYRGKLTDQAEQLMMIYKNEMPKNKYRLVKKFVFARKSLSTRFQLLRCKEIHRQHIIDTIIVKILLMAALL